MVKIYLNHSEDNQAKVDQQPNSTNQQWMSNIDASRPQTKSTNYSKKQGQQLCISIHKKSPSYGLKQSGKVTITTNKALVTQTVWSLEFNYHVNNDASIWMLA